MMYALSMLISAAAWRGVERHGAPFMCAPNVGDKVSPAAHHLIPPNHGAALIAERAKKQAELLEALRKVEAKREAAAADSSGIDLSAADLNVLAEWRIKVTGRLGKGHFGIVLLGERQDNGRLVAVKLARELEREARVLRVMSGIAGFPELHHYHKVRRHHRDDVTGANAGANEMLVVDRFGPSLQDRWEAEARTGGAFGPTRLPAKMVLRVGRATLRCLRELHHAGVVHNDVKPANIMLNEPGDPHSVHLIDFGISTRAEWSEGDVCMVDCDVLEADAVGASAGAIATDAANAELLDNYCSLPVETVGYSGYLRLQTRAGTPAFASVRQQRGEEPHAREVDDIEALTYTLAYVAAGSLPWQDAPPETAVVWKQRLMAEGWDATFAVSSVADTLSCAGGAPSAKMAKALRALWAQVLACQEPGTSVDYEACLAALE